MARRLDTPGFSGEARITASESVTAEAIFFSDLPGLVEDVESGPLVFVGLGHFPGGVGQGHDSGSGLSNVGVGHHEGFGELVVEALG